MSAFYDLASLVLVPSGYKASKVYAQKPLTTDGQLTFSRASTATRVNSAGLIETVSSNVPRLDYTNSTCPKLLLEPSRTNVFTKNTEFNHGDWVKRSGMIVTGDYGISPDGTQNADRIQFGTSSDGYIYQARTISASTAYTISTYAKGTGTIQFNIFDGTGAFTSSIFTLTSEWQRFSFSITTNSTTGVGDMGFYISNDAQVWGAQLEAGAYQTSVILTTTAAVTRLRDDLAKSGISTLIGQTAGTVFVEFEFSGSKDTYWPVITVMGASSAELIEIYGSGGSNGLGVFMLDNGVTQFSQNRTISVGRHKLAIAYELNNTVAYLDGTIMGTVDTSCTIPTMTQIGIGEFAYSSGFTFGDRINQAMLFKTRLTNAQLAELTAL